MATNSNRTAKALVTGASGFVGGHLVEHLLERGQAVRCLVRQTSNLRYMKNLEVELAYGGLDDLTDWDAAFDGVDTIYHVAGLPFARRARDYFSVNHLGTNAILAAAVRRRATLRRFVHVSSLAAVGPAVEGHPVTEQTVPNPITPYGRSKLMAEEAVLAVRDIVPVTIVRPPAVYGPRDYAVYEGFKTIARGVSPMIGRDDKQVSMIHVRDLVEGIVLAGESDISVGKTYFISSETAYSLHSMTQLIAKVMDRNPRMIAIPPLVAYCLAAVVEASSFLLRNNPVINRDKIRDLTQPAWACSIEAAKRDLGFSPKIELEAGLRQTFEWYKQEGWL
jgi:dihydroflavonol-4-reductase